MTMNLDTMSREELQALIAKLASNQAKPRALSLKVTEKGGVALYGMGRFPTTLYKTQWLKVLDMADDIRQFIKDNDALLSVKAEVK